MKKYRLLILLITLNSFSSFAQKKKDLLDKIESYKTQIKSLEVEIARINQRQQLTEEKFQKAKNQNLIVEQEKQELLKTISGFALVSKQKAENLNSSLETIKQKDRQLKNINDALAAAENEKLRKLTLVRDSLGTIGKVGFKDEVLVIAVNNNDLYGADDMSTNLTETGLQNIKKLGDYLNKYPKYKIAIEGNSNALNFNSKDTNLKDNWDLSALQANTVARVLHSSHNIDPNRITVIANSEFKTKGINTVTTIVIQPTFDAFFQLVKETMK